MGNRFTRNIQNVRNIDKLPLNTNEQNDLISDQKGNVYVRNLSSYERITGLKKLEDAFNTLQERLKDFDPNNEEVENLIKKINNNKIELEKKINDIRDEVNAIDIPNYEDEINTLRENIDNIEIKNYDKDIEYLQSQLNEIDIKDYEQDINNLSDKIDALEIPNYDDDIQSLNNALNELEIPSLDGYLKEEDTINWQKHQFTKDDGRIEVVNLQDDFNNLNNLNTGIYYATSLPEANDYDSNTSGWLIVLKRENSDITKHIFYPYNNSNGLTRLYNSSNDKWYDWEKIPNYEDIRNLQNQIDALK